MPSFKEGSIWLLHPVKHPDQLRLERWAEEQGYCLIQYEMRPGGSGPLEPTSVRDQVVFRIRARCADGRIRTGWLRFAPTWPVGGVAEPDVKWEGASET